MSLSVMCASVINDFSLGSSNIMISPTHNIAIHTYFIVNIDDMFI